MEFSDFFDDNDPTIAAKAMFLDEVTKSYKNGDLTKEQFDELTEDALQMEEIDKLADSLEHKTRLQEAFSTFQSILYLV